MNPRPRREPPPAGQSVTDRETAMTTDPVDAIASNPPRPACRHCGRELVPGRGELYVVSVLAVADPYPPVFTKADLALDVGAEIQRLIKQLSGLDAQEARDQVYRRLVFHLCTPCYERWIVSNDPPPHPRGER
jgi:hypothetical protein